MINARELRIGNWLLLGKQNTQVYQIIYDRGHGHSINHIDYKEDFFEPIPLTKEILEKSGIKEYPQSYFREPHIIKHSIDEAYRVYSKEKYIVFKQYDNDSFGLYGVGDNNENFCELFDLDILFKYLHQLQNLYYALTNSELNIKL